jgi:hypothetical protein
MEVEFRLRVGTSKVEKNNCPVNKEKSLLYRITPTAKDTIGCIPGK